MRSFHNQDVVDKYFFHHVFKGNKKYAGVTFCVVFGNDSTAGLGFSICRPPDQWCRKLGREISFGRAMLDMYRGEQRRQRGDIGRQARYRIAKTVYLEFMRSRFGIDARPAHEILQERIS